MNPSRNESSDQPVLPEEMHQVPLNAEVSRDVLRSKELIDSIRGGDVEQSGLREEDISEIFSILERHRLELRHDFGDYFQRLTMEGTTNILARKENAEVFLEHIAGDTALPVGKMLDEVRWGTHANAVILGSRAEGLRLAFEEGFDKSVGGKMSIVVCFDAGDLEIRGISAESTTASNKPDTVSLMRSIRGDIPTENIRFIAIRWPRGIFPKTLMSDDEIDGEGQFIIRYFTPGTSTREIQ